MSEQEKKTQRIYDLLYTKTRAKFLSLPYTNEGKELQKKSIFMKNGEWKIEQKMKRKLFNCSSLKRLRTIGQSQLESRPMNWKSMRKLRRSIKEDLKQKSFARTHRYFLNTKIKEEKKMNTATRVQILDETDCISHNTNTLGKGMNPIILPPAMGK